MRQIAYEMVLEMNDQRTEPVAISSAMEYFDFLSSMPAEVPAGPTMYIFDESAILSEYIRTE
jgi:hypothetical protein